MNPHRDNTDQCSEDCSLIHARLNNTHVMKGRGGCLCRLHGLRAGKPRAVPIHYRDEEEHCGAGGVRRCMCGSLISCLTGSHHPT